MPSQESLVITMRLPLGNSVIDQELDENLHVLRWFFAGIYTPDLTSEDTRRIYGLRACEISVNKLGPRIIQVRLNLTDFSRKIDTTVSGLIGDIIKINNEIGLTVLDILDTRVTISLFEYDALMARRGDQQYAQVKIAKG